MSSRWKNDELELLHRCEAQFKIPAMSVIRQLLVWAAQSLPDVLPPKPAWVKFEWPASGSIDLSSHWRSADREHGSARVDKWSGPYL